MALEAVGTSLVVIVSVPVAEGPQGVTATLIGRHCVLMPQPLNCLHLPRPLGHILGVAPPAIAFELRQVLGLRKSHLKGPALLGGDGR